jgi:hypothetical protein
MWAELLEGANTKLPDTNDETIELPTFLHTPTTINYPAMSKPLPNIVVNNPHVQAFFNGGAAGKVGTGGFIVFDNHESCVVAHVRHYGDEWNTNNRSEIHALQELMVWLSSHESLLG